MEPFGKEFSFKKKVSYKSQKSTKKNSLLNIRLIHRILDSINSSLLVLIFILFFLSFNSQREWSNTYKILSKKRAMNNNLLDYISKIEEFYVSKLDTTNAYRKTKPKDLLYLNKIEEKDESFLKKSFRSFTEGLNDSEYQKGY